MRKMKVVLYGKGYFMKEKLKRFAMMAAISVGVSAAIGLLFTMIELIADKDDGFLYTWWQMSCAMFIMFAAWLPAGELLSLLTKMEEDLAQKFGAALYYGTILGAKASEYVFGTYGSNSYWLAFTITALICYIVWVKNCKSEE